MIKNFESGSMKIQKCLCSKEGGIPCETFGRPANSQNDKRVLSYCVVQYHTAPILTVLCKN
jgi:hypothetical protein